MNCYAVMCSLWRSRSNWTPASTESWGHPIGSSQVDSTLLRSSNTVGCSKCGTSRYTDRSVRSTKFAHTGKFKKLNIKLLIDFLKGLVGMLMRDEIDLIAADLTVTAARLRVMDFSKPFMSSSITFLLQVSNSLWHTGQIFVSKYFSARKSSKK